MRGNRDILPTPRTVGAAVLVCFLGACSDDPLTGLQVCNQVGCDDGVMVTLTGEVPPIFTIKISGPDLETRTFEWDCVSNPCRGWRGAFLANETPSEVTVEVSWEGGTVTSTFKLEYEIHQPNGPDCPPTCRQAQIQMLL